MTRLLFVNPTTLKRRPVAPDELKSHQKLAQRDKSELAVLGIEPAENNHYRVLFDKPLDFGGRDVKAAYVPVRDVFFEDQTLALEISAFTWQKDRLKQASTLKPGEKQRMLAGDLVPITGTPEKIGDHLKVQLKGFTNRFAYYYIPHVRVVGTEGANNPVHEITVQKLTIPAASKDTVAAAPATKKDDKGPTINLPGYKSKFYLNGPIIPGGHFTWAEATKNGTRIPVSKLVVDRIIAMAKVMEVVRKALGGVVVKVTSWYRPREINRAVGGSSASSHIDGWGIDFYVEHLTAFQMYRKVHDIWGNRGGIAASARGGFLHLDLRGYYATWAYG